MKNIWKIFSRDIKGLSRNFFALVIAVGICMIPSLYAWFNIYSNWDPYANTSNIRIAVATEDEGYTLTDGSFVNMGDEVVEQLKENTSIGWEFLDTADEAMEGVYSGDYYAAVVISSDFTYSMYNVFSQDFENPTIIYYENEKKNAIATKITDTAVSTLKQSINAQFIEVVATTVFQQTNLLSEEIEEGDAMAAIEAKLGEISKNLSDYDAMLGNFIEGNQLLSEQVSEAKSDLEEIDGQLDAQIDKVNEAKSNVDTSATTLGEFSETVSNTMTEVENSIDAVYDAINSGNKTDAAEAVNTLMQRLDTLYEALETIQNGAGLSDETKQNIQDILDAVDEIRADGDEITQLLETSGELAGETLSGARALVKHMNAVYAQEVSVKTDELMDAVTLALTKVTELLSDVDASLSDMGTVFDGVAMTISGTGESFEQIQSVIQTFNEKLSDILEQLSSVEDDEKVETFIKVLQGDPDTYGRFFAEPVEVETTEIYAISNYGSAVAPFYTVLALWVGALILVSIIKVKANATVLEQPKPHELFFGRYLLFFLMGQIQAVIVVLGNLLILHCQVLNPFLFWLAASLTSFTFTLLIYSLTLSFGDIGKALAVVIMVIQIAGSGGTYPIEILPDFYRNVYIFFPFPYAMNAMRETIGGMYGLDYVKSLTILLLFAVAALAIGLLVRIPFMGLNHFVEKRMEDTKMM